MEADGFPRWRWGDFEMVGVCWIERKYLQKKTQVLFCDSGEERLDRLGGCLNGRKRGEGVSGQPGRALF